MYVSPNFKSKKDLKAAVANGEEVRVFSPGPFSAPDSGITSVEGPWSPAAHSWWARVYVENWLVVKVLR